VVHSFTSLVAALFLILLHCQSACAGEGNDKASTVGEVNVSTADSSADAALEQGLALVVTVDFQNVSVNDVVKFLEQRNIHARADQETMEDAGIAPGDARLTLQATGISLRAALQELLDTSQLTYYVADGRLVITTQDDAATQTTTRVYPVNDLVHPEANSETTSADYDSLIELLTTTVYPSTWDEVGGPGSISPFQGTLVVSQTYTIHEAIRGVLAALRESRRQQRQPAASEPICAESPRLVALIKQLAQKSSLRGDFTFKATPLKEAVAQIGKHFDLSIVLDLRALSDAGVDVDTPISCELRDASPQLALETMLGPVEATWIFSNEMIQVTTRDDAVTEMLTYIYPVPELIESATGKTSDSGQFDALIEVITTTIAPNTWNEVGGPGTITSFPNTSSLAVGQTRDRHEEISRLLAGLRLARTVQPASANASAPAKSARRAVGITKTYQLDAKLDPKTVAMLVQGIEPESWQQRGFQTHIKDHQLIVRNSREVHRRIDAMLRNARPDSSGGMKQGMGMM